MREVTRPVTRPVERPVSARGLVTGLVAVVVVGAAALAGDRVAEAVVERRAVQAIEQHLDGVVGTPQVELGGFPFLTQLVRGSLDEVVAHVDGVTLAGIAAVDVDVHAQDVSTARPYSAGSATVAATLPTASVEQVVAQRTGLDLDVTVVGDALSGAATLLGVPLALTLTPRVDVGRLLVDVGNLRLGGLTVTVDDLPKAVRDRLTDLQVPVDDLPAGLSLSRVEVVANGVRITATGTDVVVGPEDTSSSGAGAGTGAGAHAGGSAR